MSAPKYSRYYTYIKPVIENKVARSVASYAFSIITITILVLFAIKPTVSTILNLQKSIENNQEALATLKTKAENLYAGKDNLDRLDSVTRAKIEDKIPSKSSVPSLIRNLQNSSISLASTSALQIQPLLIIDNAGPDQKTGLTLSEINFSYNVQGSFPNLLAILQNLRRSERLISISSVILNRSDGPTVLSINGKAYFLK